MNTNPNRLSTIDGETLMGKPLQPLNFVVDTLISQGLHILAGSPKVGKSWLALWLAVTVAKGEPVWGLPVKRGTTLYLCLEDSQLRVQNRLFDVTEDAPPNVHFCTESRILSDGLTEQLEQFLREHRDAPLVSLYSCPFPVPALCFQYHVACFHCFFSCSSYLIFLLILFTALFIILYRQMPKCNMAF